jgi:peroxiredoxin
MPEDAVDPSILKKLARRSKLFDAANIILLIAVAIAIFWIVKLSRDQAAIKRSMAGVEGTLSGPQSSQIGDLVPPFKTVNLSEQPAEISYNGTSKYLLFIFSPRCDVCQQEIVEFNRLSSRFQARGFQVRGISIDPLSESKQNLKDRELDFETLIMPNMAVQRTYRVVSIPQIMIVSSRGQVEWVHYGALTPDNISGLISMVS